MLEKILKIFIKNIHVHFKHTKKGIEQNITEIHVYHLALAFILLYSDL